MKPYLKIQHMLKEEKQVFSDFIEESRGARVENSLVYLKFLKIFMITVKSKPYSFPQNSYIMLRYNLIESISDI